MIALALLLACVAPAAPAPGPAPAPGEALGAPVAPVSVPAPVATTAAPSVPPIDVPVGGWASPMPGLDVGSFASPVASDLGDSVIRVVRMDPARFSLKLADGTDGHDESTALEYLDVHGGVAAINAGMFEPDYTSTGLMRTGDRVNKGVLNDYKSVLLWDPLVPGLPAVRLLDRTAEKYEDVASQWGSAVQSLRMVGKDGKTAWATSSKKWSVAAVGLDREGRLLFLHARSPWPMRTFTDVVRGLPLDVTGLQYCEGGPEAQLAVDVPGLRTEWYGSYETGFVQNDDNRQAWPVPNLLVVVAK